MACHIRYRLQASIEMAPDIVSARSDAPNAIWFGEKPGRLLLRAQKLQRTICQRGFECLLDDFCRDIQPAALRNDVLEILSLLSIGRSVQNSLYERVQATDRSSASSDSPTPW
jgi:hypothetical protein